jgi:hypothetical protein
MAEYVSAWVLYAESAVVNGRPSEDR